MFGLRTIGGNALSILTSDAMNRATSFVLYALVARRLGAHEFGQLALALSLFYTFQIFAIGGLKTLIIREVARDRAQTGDHFLNGAAIVVATSLCTMAAAFGFVRLMNYAADTSLVICLLSLGLLPSALSAVCEAIFQAWEEMRLIPWVNVPGNLCKVGSAFLLLSSKQGLFAIIVVLLLSMLAVAAAECWILVRRFPVRGARLDFRSALRMARSALTFLGIDGSVAIESSLNLILLSKLSSESQVGFYSAAVQLMAPVLLVYQSIAQTILPMLCKEIGPDSLRLKQTAERATEFLLALALPTVVGAIFLGDWLLVLAYRNPVFLQAFPALRIIFCVLVLQVFSSMLGQVLVAVRRERVVLRIAVVDILLNICIGWLLIGRFGLVGAAITFFLVRMACCLQHCVAVWDILQPIPIVRIAWKPALAAVGMAACLILTDGRSRILSGMAATLVYFAALAALTVWTSGGPREFRAKYLPLLSR